MTPFEYLLKDEEIAAVLNIYSKQFCKTKPSPITAEQVAQVRAAEKPKQPLQRRRPSSRAPFDKNQTDRLLVATEKSHSGSTMSNILEN